jgi:hypothetical protein
MEGSPVLSTSTASCAPVVRPSARPAGGSAKVKTAVHLRRPLVGAAKVRDVPAVTRPFGLEAPAAGGAETPCQQSRHRRRLVQSSLQMVGEDWPSLTSCRCHHRTGSSTCKLNRLRRVLPVVCSTAPAAAARQSSESLQHSLMVTRMSRRRTLAALGSKLGSRMSGATTTTSVSAGKMAAEHGAHYITNKQRILGLESCLFERHVNDHSTPQHSSHPDDSDGQ